MVIFFFVSLSFQQHSHTRRIQGWKVIYIQFVLIHKALNTTLLLTHLTSQCDTQWYPLTFMSSAPGKNSYLSNYWGPSFTSAYWVLVLQHKNEWVSIGAAVQVSWSQPEQKGKKNLWSSLDKLWDLFQSDFSPSCTATPERVPPPTKNLFKPSIQTLTDPVVILLESTLDFAVLWCLAADHFVLA